MTEPTPPSSPGGATPPSSPASGPGSGRLEPDEPAAPSSDHDDAPIGGRVPQTDRPPTGRFSRSELEAAGPASGRLSRGELEAAGPASGRHSREGGSGRQPRTDKPATGRIARASFLDTHRDEYTAQVRWLLLGRVLVVVACLVVLLVYEEGSPRFLSAAYGALVLGLVVAAGQLAAFRRVSHAPLVSAGVAFDLLLALTLVYLTGGIVNGGFTVLLFGPILSACLLVSDRAGYYAAILATFALAVIALSYWFASGHGPGALPLVPHDLYAAGGPAAKAGRVTANLIGFSVAFLGVAVLAVRLPYRVSAVRILYDEVIERMREGLVAIDKRGEVVLVNREACRLLNWSSPRALVGRRFEDVLRRREDKAILDVLARGTDVQLELTLEIRDRPPVDVEVITTVLHDDRGQVRGVIGQFRDLSLKRRLEEIERRLARLSGTEEVAMGIAHEIRTPLASIRGAVQELTRSAFHDPADKRLADLVRRESDRLDRILQEFLDYARMRPPLHGPLDLGRLVEETALLLRQRPDAAAVDLRCPTDAGRWIVQGDQDQLRQAFLNLGGNALEALGGRGRLHIRLREVSLLVRNEGPERSVGAQPGIEVALMNDGPPIKPNDIDRLFTPFFTTKRGGLGLGLAITQKIVRHHGGTVTCDVGELGGACFRVSLPLYTLEPPAEA